MKNVRTFIKGTLFLASLVLSSLLIVFCWIEKRLTHSEWVFTGCSQMLALVPTIVGVMLRSAFYVGTLDECHWEVHIGFGTLFSHRAARVGKHTSTGAYCVIGQAHIGAGVMIGSRVSIPSGKRQHLDDQGRITDRLNFDVVSVGEGSWIGEGAILVADVGHHCIISAGAVVVHPVESCCVAGGNPARILKRLGE
jgi:virginiamycin A acetyltransferase